MKITTWNVNGIRAIYQKGFKDWITSYGSDIYCLQEVKAKPSQLPDELVNIDGYRTLWNPAERPGYSGVATLYRVEPQDIQPGIGKDLFDVEGRVISIRLPEFTLFNVYFPNGQRDQERLSYKLDFYDHLLGVCQERCRRGEKIIITGDFNTAHREIDLANPAENAKNSGFLPEERAWIDTYLSHGFVDVYRLLYPERVQYTWWTYRFGARQRNIGWRLDYFLVSQDLVQNVEDVIIEDGVAGSDHCPVTLVLK